MGKKIKNNEVNMRNRHGRGACRWEDEEWGRKDAWLFKLHCLNTFTVPSVNGIYLTVTMILTRILSFISNVERTMNPIWAYQGLYSVPC